MSFRRLMALWLKGKEYSCETNADGNIIVYPKGNKELYAAIDPEKGEVYYYLNFAEPVTGAIIPEDELMDLRYFVGLLMGEDE